MNKQKILGMLGIALRAGELVSGTDSVIEALQKKKIKMVFVASDASNETLDTFEKKCFFYNVPIVKDFSSDELSKAIGKERKVLGIKNQGMYDSIKKLMED